LPVVKGDDVSRQVRPIKKKLTKKRVPKSGLRGALAVRPKVTAAESKVKSPLETLEPASLRQRIGLTQSEMARGLGVSDRTLLSLEKSGLSKASVATARRYREFAKLVEAVSEFVKSEAIGRWMTRTNEYFQGSSPLQVIERGDSAWVWNMIHTFRDGEPM
jgi:DNA-binding XRE family transcriptional regulator